MLRWEDFANKLTESFQIFYKAATFQIQIYSQSSKEVNLSTRQGNYRP